MSKDLERLVLVDAFAILFRAFFAIPHMSSPEGKPTNAVYGFTRILLNVIDELEPDCIAIAFDTSGDTFRDEIYPEYKANRDAPPDNFIPQISLTQKVVDAMSIPRFEMQGWEADDIIGTLAEQAASVGKEQRVSSNEYETVIVTGDQDLFQLVDDKKNIKVWIPGMRGKDSVMYQEANVIEKLGVKNTQVVDYKGLAGDSSDNIPGVRGVGPKTAVDILNQHPDLDSLYKAIDSIIAFDQDKQEITNPKAEIKTALSNLNLKPAVLKKLLTQRETAYLSRTLATISKEAPITLALDECKINGYDKKAVRNIFQEYGFKSLMRILPDDQFETDVQEALF